MTMLETGAAGGPKLEITGLIVVNWRAGTLAIEFTVTVTVPLPSGTAEGTPAAICELLQLVGVAVTPLNVIVLLPWVAPKFDPAIVTEVPTGPRLGDNPLRYGVVPTVIETLLKVAVFVPLVLPLPTANPTLTVCAIVMVTLLPACAQVVPSADV